MFAGSLEPPASATVVRAGDGGLETADGPFAAARQRLGGFRIVEAADREAALILTARASRACARPVEVRAFED